MYRVIANQEKNRIYLILGGVETGDGERFYNEIMVQTAKLEKPFTCISDITNFSFNDPGEAVWADRAMKALVDAGMVRAVRVTGMDVPTVETREKYGHVVSLSRTMEEAEKILDDYENLS